VEKLTSHTVTSPEFSQERLPYMNASSNWKSILLQQEDWLVDGSNQLIVRINLLVCKGNCGDSPGAGCCYKFDSLDSNCVLQNPSKHKRKN
jgi:hypothetical protein